MPNSLEFPPFRARTPWWGPDLQTVRNALRGAAIDAPAGASERLWLPMSDASGDVLAACVNRLPSAPAAPLVVLIHGLSGSEDSAYMWLSARHWLARGHPVVRLNLRGAGASRERCSLQYHAGRTQDLRDALRGLDLGLVSEGLVLVGYSLGGNMLLKFLAEFGREFPIVAAASVSAPIDLAAASRRFLEPRNTLYHRHLLQSMKQECFGGVSGISAEEQNTVARVRSIYEFDDHFVAPRNGFRDAEHYYDENHARRFLADIEVPTLLVHALDDPWIPAEAYTSYPWQRNPHLRPLLSPGGGHVGFHDRLLAMPWYDHCIAIFVDRLRHNH